MATVNFLNDVVFLKQNVNTAECKAVVHACVMNDIKYRTVDINNLQDYKDGFCNGTHIPVGSVEYIRKVFEIAGIEEPTWYCYPECLNQFLYRKVELTTIGNIKNISFIKPAKTKLWTGVIYDSSADINLLSEHDREQYETIYSCPQDTVVWSSDLVKFISEYRYYISNGNLIGYARYDTDGPDDAPEPNINVLNECIKILTNEHGNNLNCSIDLGILDNGKTALVELNDAWALGLYEKSVKSIDYLDMLCSRWKQIIKKD